MSHNGTVAIRNHTFTRHRRAVAAIEKAVGDLDRDLRGLARRQDLYPGERLQQERAARQQAEAAIRTARVELVEAIADSKRLATYAPDAPVNPDRVRYYQEQARAELAGMRPDQQLTIVQQVVASGDRERAAEYIRAARGPLTNSEHASELRKLERQVEPQDAKLHRSWEAAIATVESNVPWLDRWVEEDLSSAGRVSSAVKAGLEPEVPLDTGKISKWLPRVEHEASQMFTRSAAEQDGVEPPVWAQPRRVFGDGQPDTQGGSAVEAGAG